MTAALPPALRPGGAPGVRVACDDYPVCGRDGCEACAAAWVEHRRARRRATYTPTRSVRAAEVRARILPLVEAGISQAAIARAAGVAGSTVSNLLADPDRRWVRGDAARKLLSVDWRAHTEEGLVDATECRRMIQHLQLGGWTQSEIERRTGLDQTWLSTTALARWTTIEGRLAGRLRDFFDAHWAEDGGSSRARSAARRRGWVSYFAYDNPADPDCKPDGAL